MMLYLLAIQMFVTTLAHLSSSRHLAGVFCGLVLLCQALVSHYVIHKDDLPVWVHWIRYARYYNLSHVLHCHPLDMCLLNTG